MGEVVNLNRARKTRDRVAKATRADANRAKFGRTKAERGAVALEAAHRERTLDDAKRD